MNEFADSTSHVTRRQVVAATGIAVSGALTGCLGGTDDGQDPGDGTETPEPVDLSGGKQDDQGGMIIGEHFGPNGQIFYAEHAPDGRNGPAWFHTLTTGLFPYHFEKEARGWNAVAIYVTDYSLVDYELSTHDGETYISSHTAQDSFALAQEVTYVAGSGVRGGMGETLIPFSAPEDVDAFTDEHGGQAVEFDDVDDEFLAEHG